MTSKWAEKLPSLFIVGCKDFRFDSELKSFLKEFQISGISLFNSPHDSEDFIWKDPDAALERIYDFIRQVREKVAFIAVDQEGGRVRRFRSPFVELPRAQLIGEYYREEKRPDRIFELYRLAARQLFLSGVQLNFAPVADLRHADSTAIIADRSFSDNRTEVVSLVKLFCEAMNTEDVYCTLKHYPGHGPTKIDSHEAIAVIEKDPPDYLREDTSIFEECADDAFAVMTAHIAHAENPKRIFSLDAQLIEEARAKLPTHLAWMTDDLMTMKAVNDLQPWRACLDAGYDYLNICGDLHQNTKAIEDSIRYIESKRLDFGAENRLEVKCRHSAEHFREIPELARFKDWKAQILELSEQAAEILEAERLI